MDLYYYAQIDENGKCYAVSQLSEEILTDNLIRIDSYDETLLGRQYGNGEWISPSEPEPERQSIPPVTNEEVIQATMEVRAMMDVLADQGAASETSRLSGNNDTHLSRYDFWRKAYFKNHTKVNTLQRLTEGGVLTQDEVNGIVEDRIAEFGV